MMSYEDYITQFVEINGMPNCIKNVKLGTKILQCTYNTIVSKSLLEIGTITHNLYNSSYLINTLSSRNNVICKIKRKGKIYFLNNNHNTFSKPPINTTTCNDFAILDQYGNHIDCQLYKHNINTELNIEIDQFMLCIFKFDDFKYTSELDYTCKNINSFLMPVL